MSLTDKSAAIAAIALSLVGSGCGSPYGGPEAISDIPNKSVTVKYDRAGLVVTLDYSDPSGGCDLLNDDAFARLNGQSVPLFRGEIQIIPPQGDDGGFACIPPSVRLDQIRSDLSRPWTVEIGDASEIVAVTFGPGPVNPFDVGPLANSVLRSSLDSLTVPIQRHTGDATPALAKATFTASDGQSSLRVVAVGDSGIMFENVIDPGWPPGPITVQIEVDYYAGASLLDCRAPKCSLVQESGSCTPPGPAPGIPCGDVLISSTTNVFTIQLVCQPTNGVCS